MIRLLIILALAMMLLGCSSSPANQPAPAAPPASKQSTKPEPASSPSSKPHGAVRPVNGACPQEAPIKGNRGGKEWIYHVPSGGSYKATRPEECFGTEAGAQAAGYRRAQR